MAFIRYIEEHEASPELCELYARYRDRTRHTDEPRGAGDHHVLDRWGFICDARENLVAQSYLRRRKSISVSLRL